MNIIQIGEPRKNHIFLARAKINFRNIMPYVAILYSGSCLYIFCNDEETKQELKGGRKKLK